MNPFAKGPMTGAAIAIAADLQAHESDRAAWQIEPCADEDGELIALGAALERGRLREVGVFAATYPDEKSQDKAVEAVTSENAVLAQRIGELEAKTIGGLGVKLQAVKWCHSCQNPAMTSSFFTDAVGTDLWLAGSLLADLERLIREISR